MGDIEERCLTQGVYGLCAGRKERERERERL